jgi:hypothetical protein
MKALVQEMVGIQKLQLTPGPTRYQGWRAYRRFANDKTANFRDTKL